MSLEERVLAIQRGQADADSLLAEYTPFISAAASRASGRRVGRGDEEFACAMSAFHEAILSYQGDKGGFLRFATVVIRRRLIDNRRAEIRRQPEVVFSALSREEGSESQPFEIADDSQMRRRIITEEIEALSAELTRYGIRFTDLAKTSPRSEKTRQACAGAVRALLADSAALASLRSCGHLPLSYLQKISRAPQKTLERHRKYIIAAAEVLSGDYPCLSEYFHTITGGRNK